MVRDLGVWFILMSFLISIFPLKTVISTKSKFSDENVSGDAFRCPFLGDQKKGRISGMQAQNSSLRHISILFAEVCELCSLFTNTGRIEATVFA